MQKKLKKLLTTDELAWMTQRGFADADEKVEKKFVAVHYEMSKLATKEDVHGLKSDIQESEGRLLNAINGIDVKRTELEDLREDVRELTARMSSLEKKR